MQSTDDPMIVEPLRREDGGGTIATVPDLPGCASDGATPEEAVRNVQDAIAAWIEEARAIGRPIPAPPRAPRRRLTLGHSGAGSRLRSLRRGRG